MTKKREVWIEPYHGHGTEEVFYLKGRVLEGRRVPKARAGDPRLRNLVNTVRRFRPGPVPGVPVRARFEGAEGETVTDASGFFDLALPLRQPLGTGAIWNAVEVEVPEDERRVGERAEMHVLVPPPSAEFGIISDIDDTVVHTGVTNWLTMARVVLFGNAHTRFPFPDVDAFYRALQAGPEDHSYNPVFYVSSSPWNLYDLLEHFFRLNGIPVGPLFLRQFRLSLRRGPIGGHRSHKLEMIHTLFDAHPELSFVLIGDSGQKDPEIYREVVRAYPGRVRAIYIRDVTTSERDHEVHAIAREVEALGVEMRPVKEKSEAAEHAAELGLISRRGLEEVRGDRRPEAPDPSVPAERIDARAGRRVRGE